MSALWVARCCWIRGVHLEQRGHFHFLLASKVVEKVWPLLQNSGQRVSDLLIVENSGWMKFLLFAGGGRGESWGDCSTCKNTIINLKISSEWYVTQTSLIFHLWATTFSTRLGQVFRWAFSIIHLGGKILNRLKKKTLKCFLLEFLTSLKGSLCHRKIVVVFRL